MGFGKFLTATATWLLLLSAAAVLAAAAEPAWMDTAWTWWQGMRP